MLDALPPPLRADFYAGRWLPMVGAGFSRNAQLPDGQQMPDWNELGRLLNTEMPDYTAHGPIDAISAYEEEYGRSRLVERLAELLALGHARPGKAHDRLARVGFDLILTTNFDFLLEDAYNEARQYCTPLLTEEQLPQRPLDGQVQLLKLHGDLNHPVQMVATEDDFDGFLARRPLIATFVANLFITRTPVFLGYSFEDADTRSIWTLIKDRLDHLRRKGYALMVNPSPTEVARFERRGINVVALPSDSYEEAFAQLFEELSESYTGRLGEFARPTEDDVAAQLVLPPGVDSRLCFCSVPVQLLAWYREEVFPAIREAGFVPVTLNDVVAPGSNIAATVNALMGRARVALIDGTSANSRFELGRALEKLKPDEVIVILDSAEEIGDLRTPLMSGDLEVIVRDDDVMAEPEALVDRIRSRLERIGGPPSEPRRLLTDGYANAALTVAFTEFEGALRENAPPAGRGRPPGLHTMVRRAAEGGLVNADELSRIEGALGLRNRVVHGQPGELDAVMVGHIIDDIERITQRLRQTGASGN